MTSPLMMSKITLVAVLVTEVPTYSIRCPNNNQCTERFVKAVHKILDFKISTFY